MSPKQLIYICILNFMVAVGSLSQIYLIITSELKVVPITKLMETTLPSLCFATCYYNLLSHVTIMKKILRHIKCDWDNLAHKPELIILKEYANRTRTYTLIIAIAFYLYITSLIFPSVLRIFLYYFDEANETVLTLPVCLDNFMKGQINHYLALLFECVFLFIMSTIGIAHYSIFVLITQHTCALFNVVASKIEKRFKSNPHKFNHANNRSKLAQEYEWLVDIIESYDNAIEFLFQLLSYSTNTNEGLQKCIYIIGSMFVIYIYNYLGQKLIDYHTEIYMKFTILLVIIENTENVTFFHNEEHGAMQFITERSYRIWRYDVSPKQLIYICALNFMIAVGSFSQIYLLLASELKVVPIIKLMETTLPSLCFAMCYYNILVNTTTVRNSNISFCIISDKNVCYRRFIPSNFQMKRILHHIKFDWDKLADKPELIILKRYANRTRLCTIIIAIAFYLYIIFLISPSAVRFLLYSLNVANETKLVLPNYYWAFFFECAFIFIISTIGIAHYSMFVLIVQHACALFNIVASRIEDGFKSNPLNLNDANHSIFAQEYEWLVDIIKLYDNAVDFANLMKLYHEKIYPFEVFSSLLFIIISYLYLLSFTMSNSILLVFIENAKNVTLYDNEEHDAMQSFYKGSDCIIQSAFCCVRKKHLLVDYWTKGGETLDRNLSQEVVRIFDPEKCIGLKLIEMKKILYSIKCDWDKLANKPELIILKRYASRSKLCTITIAISFYLYITFLMLPSVVCILPHVFGVVNGTELALPIHQMHYYLTFFFECTLLTVICTIGIAYCSMFVSTIQHACALFDIVTWMIEKRFKNNQHNFYRDYTRKFAQEYEWIIGIIEFYDNAINCQIPFYSLSLKTQKILLFLILKSMKSYNLSVKGIIVISHYLFATYVFEQKKYFENEYYVGNFRLFKLIGFRHYETSLKQLMYDGFLNFMLPMKKILYRFKWDWDKLKNKPELIILKKYTSQSRFCCLSVFAFLMLLSVICILLYIFDIVNETKLILPVCVNYLLKEKMHYYLITIPKY
ncbi:odorant receptor 46a-like isoform X1 [Vespula maculifrons]|uniref:Odorant receptor 46a-like isoform X1 n=1 Tax=Vespula maculifrons TaxID=7453 RepID=A0ABD2BPM4_VESMC